MTTIEYELFNGSLFCKKCNTHIEKHFTSYKDIDENGFVKECNVCKWIKRHNGVPTIDNYSYDDIIKTLNFFIYEKSVYINDLSKELDRSLDDTIYLYKKLNIKGKKCLVKSSCECCGNEIENFPSVYLKNKHLYCSTKCYHKDKSNKIKHGSESQFYNRIVTNCTNCNKEIKIIPYDYNKKNKFGDNNNFCSQKCYWEYRSKYYIGNKSPQKNRVFTDEQREKCRENIIRNITKSNRLNTSIQLKVNDVLDRMNVVYDREHIIKYYSVDNYLLENNLIIEIMGDYWHGSPLKYNEDRYKLNNIQQRTILKDKQKSSYIYNKHNIRILYLWESDINKNIKLCEKLISLYIKNNGQLENYHSFNWYIKNDSLFLCKNLIIPYQDMVSDNYKHLIK